jgi:hypothetical protein
MSKIDSAIMGRIPHEFTIPPLLLPVMATESNPSIS